MTIDEAIEVLSCELVQEDIRSFYDFQKALKLGIEALRRLQQRRIIHSMGNKELLPGETK